jgi:hypothetical protein
MSLALLRAFSDRSALVCTWIADALTGALEEPEGSLTRVLVELVERGREAQPSLS